MTNQTIARETAERIDEAGIDRICTRCGAAFIQTAKTRRCYCPKCRCVKQHELRMARKLAGNPIQGKAETLAKYRARPEVKKRNIVRAMKYIEPGSPYRHKYECRWKTRRAIASGSLIKQPCADCGKVKVQAHHEDYTKPLEVIWLCSGCHSKRHYPIIQPTPPTSTPL